MSCRFPRSHRDVNSTEWLSQMFRVLSLVCFLALAMSAVVGSAQEAGCQLHEVTSRILNVSKDQAGEVFIDVLQQGDVACVVRPSTGGGNERGFVAHKMLKSGDKAQIDGWVRLSYLKPVSMAAVAPSASAEKPAARPSAAPPQPSTAQQANSSAPSPPPLPPNPAPATIDADDVRRFDQPIPFGPVPVNGSTLRTLANSVPLFSPLEGLDAAQCKHPVSTAGTIRRHRYCVRRRVLAPR